MKYSLVLCVASSVVLAGCATGYPATYNSLPQGATLVCGNSVKGVTPFTGYTSAAVLEQLSELRRKDEQLYDDARARGVPEQAIAEARAKNESLGCRAVWPSGATALYEPVDADTAKAHPKGVDLLVSHPGDSDARAVDYTRALQAQQSQGQQQPVQAQQAPVPVFRPQPLPTMPAVAPPSPPGRTTTICRTLSNGTFVCD